MAMVARVRVCDAVRAGACSVADVILARWAAEVLHFMHNDMSPKSKRRNNVVLLRTTRQRVLVLKEWSRSGQKCRNIVPYQGHAKV
eukprot:scaffold21650_cov76-Skeletonema_dohrnii-CCMP3373.AAC.2